MDKQAQKAIKALRSKMPFFGSRIRRNAALKLAGTCAPDAVDPLLAALNDPRPDVGEAAWKALTSLQGGAVDFFCALWAQRRSVTMEKVLMEREYVAEDPLWLNMLTLLKLSRLETACSTGAQGVDILLELIKDADPTVSANAGKVLGALKNPEGIDRLCALWETGRDSFLADLLTTCGYTANSPAVLAAKTSFFQGSCPHVRLPQFAVESCLNDRDEIIVRAAAAYMMADASQWHEESIFYLILSNPGTRIAQVFNQQGWRPDNPADRALFYFLAGDLDRYHDIDFDQSHLRLWYETSDAALKEAIASRIRQSGDARLLAVFRTARGTRKTALTLREVDLQLEIMQKNNDFTGMFALLPFADHGQGMRIMATLQKAGWRHCDPRMAELQRRLEALLPKQAPAQQGPCAFAGAIYSDFRPMFMGSEKPPQSPAAVRAWLTDGSFRRRSAALITMAEANAPGLGEAANTACADDFWQVRMAAAAAEMLHPGTLSPANKALLAQDHVHWVQALLQMPAGSRLVDVRPDDLEKMKNRGLKSRPDQKPAGPDDFFELLAGLVGADADYLLAMAEYLETTPEVSADAAYDAGAADVEIEVE